MASTRISRMAFMRAKIGAIGNAATNIVTKPYWRTKSKVTKLVTFDIIQN